LHSNITAFALLNYGGAVSVIALIRRKTGRKWCGK